MIRHSTDILVLQRILISIVASTGLMNCSKDEKTLGCTFESKGHTMNRAGSAAALTPEMYSDFRFHATLSTKD
jgi:hypothetical protein